MVPGSEDPRRRPSGRVLVLPGTGVNPAFTSYSAVLADVAALRDDFLWGLSGWRWSVVWSLGTAEGAPGRAVLLEEAAGSSLWPLTWMPETPRPTQQPVLLRGKHGILSTVSTISLAK